MLYNLKSTEQKLEPEQKRTGKARQGYCEAGGGLHPPPRQEAGAPPRPAPPAAAGRPEALGTPPPPPHLPSEPFRVSVGSTSATIFECPTP
jgi:hypothetical protein